MPYKYQNIKSIDAKLKFALLCQKTRNLDTDQN